MWISKFRATQSEFSSQIRVKRTDRRQIKTWTDHLPCCRKTRIHIYISHSTHLIDSMLDRYDFLQIQEKKGRLHPHSGGIILDQFISMKNWNKLISIPFYPRYPEQKWCHFPILLSSIPEKRSFIGSVTELNSSSLRA